MSMHSIVICRLLLLALLMSCASVRAQDGSAEQIRQQIARLQPDLAVERVERVAGSDLFEVRLKGGEFLYTDKGAEFILHGQLYQVRNDSAVNLTEQARQEVTAGLIGNLDVADMVVFPAAETRARITVFTDVDCGYCQKLHGEVEALTTAGIEVRYLAWPRQGLSGNTYDTMVSIWCADDRLQAMNRAKQRQPVAAASCRHPVDRQHALGQQIGVRGTPAIVLENGELIPGYLPAAELVARAVQAKN